MPRWQVTYDPKLDGPRFAVSKGFGHALLVPIVANIFQGLRVPASLWEHGQEWFGLHMTPSILSFELEHGTEGRAAYDDRCFSRLLAGKKPVVGEHGGYWDLFAPVIVGGEVEAALVCGPFLRKRPGRNEILERWRALTGRQGHPADAEFASFLAATHQALVLEGDTLSDFVDLVGCVAQLLSGEGDAARAANRAQRLRKRVQETRFPETMWEAVRTILDDRSARRRLYPQAHALRALSRPIEGADFPRSSASAPRPRQHARARGARRRSARYPSLTPRIRRCPHAQVVPSVSGSKAWGRRARPGSWRDKRQASRPPGV